ncbi:hypothetical protein SCLCIDRAFT_423178 [Scleroderma citrinum Foug A]|uniref:Uncharacterized protein n=1 Tax=Scleroderma citrinum Foug A TaxID=1036808 RepID=A0A0C3EC75_9AGAM|nr:hypothetical protein SCLCIDRAFT_423178 [Scleroderma citrinum Foug A]
MGGRAFSQELPSDSFQRLPQPLYQSLKDRLRPLLLTIYTVVEVPPEAPAKKDHGDIDFVVSRPVQGMEVNPALVSRTLGAVKSVELDSNRTSHYALEMSQDDMLLFSHSLQRPFPVEKAYVQVDVRVCLDDEEVERLMVLHGYGDLGIMIGAIVRSHGLSLSTKGLKAPSPPPDPPILLSSSPRAIFDFLGLSMNRWNEGFTTIEDIFVFASTSRFFDPRRFRAPQMPAFDKTVTERTMYRDFRLWAKNKELTAVHRLEDKRDRVEEALLHFGKKGEWDAAAHMRYTRSWLKSNFNGKLVAEWTGLGWKGVKAVMDDVRASGADEAALIGRPLEDIKTMVMASKDSLSL